MAAIIPDANYIDKELLPVLIYIKSVRMMFGSSCVFHKGIKFTSSLTHNGVSGSVAGPQDIR